MKETEKNKDTGSDKYVVIVLEVLLLSMFLFSLLKDVIIHFRESEGGILASVTRGERSMTALYTTYGIITLIYTMAVQVAEAFKRNKVLILVLNFIMLIYLFFFSSYFRNSIFFSLLRRIMTD